MLERARELTDGVTGQIEAARRRRTADLVLELDLTEPLTEGVAQDPVSAVMARRRTALGTVLEGLSRASRDPRVRALVVKLGGSQPVLSPARAQELRQAVLDFRDGGKLAVAWAETFGELGRGTVPYYLATGFDEIWLQPSGDVCLTGVAVEMPFFRGALDKAGVTLQVGKRHEYKNAADVLTEPAFTTAHREATERLVQSLMEQLVAGIAAGRNLDATQVRDLIDRAPLFATEALEAGLVDHLGYRDEVHAAVRERVGYEALLLYLGRYSRPRLADMSRRFTRSQAEALALVHVTGPIHVGKSRGQPLGRQSAGSDTVAAALRSASKAEDVKAVVLRVTSPGGSYVASDTIWRQVALTRQAGKPVVVSMGDVAASGGYFVAMGADAIVAEPTTITGSIGVLSGKLVIADLLGRLGVTHDRVAGARHGLMFSPFDRFTDEEWERLNAWLDRIYDDFVAKVAEGRGLARDRVHELARGRVWSGADAQERGLVDELGGLATAVEVAKERAGLAPSAEPELLVHPRRPLVSRLRPALSSEDRASADVGIRLDAWGTFADLAAHLGLPTHGPLTLPGDVRLT